MVSGRWCRGHGCSQHYKRKLLFDDLEEDRPGHSNEVIHRTVCSSNSSCVSRALLNAAEFLLSQRITAETALACAHIVLRRSTFHSKYAAWAAALRARAFASARGYNDVSKTMLSASMVVAARWFAQDHPFTAQLCRQQSVYSCRAGEIAAAQSSADSAYDIVKRALGPQHLVVAAYCSHCADVLSWWKSGLHCTEQDLQLAVLMRSALC